MHVGLIIDSLIPNGAQIVVQELATGLSDRGNQVTLFYYHNYNGQAPSIADKVNAHGVRTEWICGPNRTPRKYVAGIDAVRTVHKLRKMGIDIVNVHTWEAAYSLHVTTYLPRDLPVVVTHHGTKICNRDRSSMNWIHLGVNSQYRYEYEDRDDNDRCSTIDIGIDKETLDRCIVSKEQARKQLDLNTDRPVMLTIGRCSKHKGCDIWMEVVKRLDAKYHNLFKYVFVGADNRGPYYTNMVELGKNYNDVILKPTLPHEEVIRWICASDLLLVPSRTESFAVKAVEALYCGRPVITHYLGVLLDIILDGVNGKIVNYMDINALTNAAAEWLVHPRVVKANIPEKYFASTMVDRYEKCFRELLNRKHSCKSFLNTW